MGLGRTLLLGAIAGATIIFGLPVGRMRRPAEGLRTFLNATAVGVLIFLVWDVLSAAWEPIDTALGKLHEGTGGVGPAVGYGLLFAAGIAVGLLALVGYERWMARAARRATSPRLSHGPGVMAIDELRRTQDRHPVRGIAGWSAARRLTLMIAVGIGLHNFAEGLAIGQSAASGEVALATMLVIGFGLHNATEGFGIVAPLAADVMSDGTQRRPSWPFLLAMGLIGGGPTFLGTVVGHGFTNQAVAVVFLTLAAGSILFVVAQLLGVAAKSARRDLVMYGLLIGLLAGFGTDAIVTLAGA